MAWKFGQYIETLLETKGGKRAGWHKKRLSEETGLAYSHISWIIEGEASGKPNPPSITLDTLLILSKALNVHPMKLVLAYQGKDPEATNEDPGVEGQLVEFLKRLPPSLVAQAFSELDDANKIPKEDQ